MGKKEDEMMRVGGQDTPTDILEVNITYAQHTRPLELYLVG